MFSISTSIAAGIPEPLTIDDVKRNLNLSHDADTQLLLALVESAREYVENWTGLALVPKTVTHKLDRFPGYEDCYTIRLPLSPVTAFTSIAYFDENNDSQTLSAAEYQADLSSLPVRVVMVDGDSWPTTYERLAAITLTYTAGYATPAAVPERVKQAMHLLIAHWYVNREVVGSNMTEIAFSLRALLGAAWTGNYAGAFAAV